MRNQNTLLLAFQLSLDSMVSIILMVCYQIILTLTYGIYKLKPKCDNIKTRLKLFNLSHIQTSYSAIHSSYAKH